MRALLKQADDAPPKPTWWNAVSKPTTPRNEEEKQTRRNRMAVGAGLGASYGVGEAAALEGLGYQQSVPTKLTRGALAGGLGTVASHVYDNKKRLEKRRDEYESTAQNGR
jgi:uncharacterized membrane protein YebE (DUF533 family)